MHSIALAPQQYQILALCCTGAMGPCFIPEYIGDVHKEALYSNTAAVPQLGASTFSGELLPGHLCLPQLPSHLPLGVLVCKSEMGRKPGLEFPGPFLAQFHFLVSSAMSCCFISQKLRGC